MAGSPVGPCHVGGGHRCLCPALTSLPVCCTAADPCPDPTRQPLHNCSCVQRGTAGWTLGGEAGGQVQECPGSPTGAAGMHGSNRVSDRLSCISTCECHAVYTSTAAKVSVQLMTGSALGCDRPAQQQLWLRVIYGICRRVYNVCCSDIQMTMQQHCWQCCGCCVNW